MCVHSDTSVHRHVYIFLSYTVEISSLSSISEHIRVDKQQFYETFNYINSI